MAKIHKVILLLDLEDSIYIVAEMASKLHRIFSTVLQDIAQYE